MKRLSILTLLVLFASFNAFAVDTVATRLNSLLPKPLQTLTLHKSTLAEAEANLGKHDFATRDGHYYWAYEGYKYSVALQFVQNRLTTLQFKYVKNAPKIDAFKDVIKKGEFRANQKKGKPSESMPVIYSENGITLEFSPIKKTLEMVQIQ